MQDRFQLTSNGQEIQQADVNLIAKEASLADDRVLAELLRLAPYNGSTYAKAILPYTTSTGPAATIQPGTGAVTINPFRAVVGSRTAVASVAADNWNDIRSAVFIGSATTLSVSQSISANASGNPRWDVIYAAVASDQSGNTTTRYVKNPASKVVSAQTLTITLTTSVTIGVQNGTPAASPTFPAIPNDTGSTIYIPLAYVRVINGFTGATVLNNKDIFEILPLVPLSRALGVTTLRPADQNSNAGGVGISSAGTSTQNGVLAFTGTTNTRAAAYMPPTMAGSESIIVAIDCGNASSANWSHTNNSIVDASRDWRNRIFRWTAVAGLGAGAQSQFPWVASAGNGLFLAGMGVTPSAPATGYALAGGSAIAVGVGATISGGSTALAAQVCATGAAATATAAAGSNMPTNAFTSGTAIGLYADASTGALKVLIGGTPLAAVVFWLEATAPYTNA